MFEVFALLARNPRLGRPAEAIAPGVRRHEYRSHVILYEEMPDGVLILAVVHGRSVRRLSL
ncbi:type II toxin-antitoxin system RelE/ParE family toxin [Jiella avicenniae]|uniref:Type II toxin-antitoxin system RelE/ParE family toxin n=1 Tax=Jiella avicenniae TaxID=2907202 RepID=A0A9X1P5U5_9HYPH|nr:type II toxin-antitoxin system RelE/ParE family toxin [Jiella avicenniae]MCE7030379.1 type II toxin-antitoxin system RelE/ParE family toxin [Jiella avicenniae]